MKSSWDESWERYPQTNLSKPELNEFGSVKTVARLPRRIALIGITMGLVALSIFGTYSVVRSNHADSELAAAQTNMVAEAVKTSMVSDGNMKPLDHLVPLVANVTWPPASVKVEMVALEPTIAPIPEPKPPAPTSKVLAKAAPAVAAVAAAPQHDKEPVMDALESDLDLLAHLIHAEAGDQPYKGKVAVGNVVLNRVKSGKFPDTIKGVIYDPGQFSPVANESIKEQPEDSDVQAAKDALNGVNIVGDALYFDAPALVKKSWASTHRKVAAKIGGHVFYL